MKTAAPLEVNPKRGHGLGALSLLEICGAQAQPAAEAPSAREQRPSIEVPAHGLPARGPTVGRRVGQLRAGLRQSASADVHHHELRRLAGRKTPRSGGRAFCRRTIQGVEFRADADPVLYANNLGVVDRNDRRALLDALAKLQHAESNNPEILSRVSQYEMDYRMQTSVLEVYEPDVDKPCACGGNLGRTCITRPSVRCRAPVKMTIRIGRLRFVPRLPLRLTSIARAPSHSRAAALRARTPRPKDRTPAQPARKRGARDPR